MAEPLPPNTESGPRCTCKPPDGVTRNHANGCALFSVRAAYRQAIEDAARAAAPSVEPGELSDYQRGYLDGFHAPANVAARAAAPPVEPHVEFEYDPESGDVTAFNDDLRIMAIGATPGDAETRFRAAAPSVECEITNGPEALAEGRIGWRRCLTHGWEGTIENLRRVCPLQRGYLDIYGGVIPRSPSPDPVAGLREALPGALHEVGGGFCDPFDPDHPVAMHNSQAAALAALLDSPDPAAELREALDAAARERDVLRALVGRAARMGSCSQTHHEHLANDARAALHRENET